LFSDAIAHTCLSKADSVGFFPRSQWWERRETRRRNQCCIGRDDISYYRRQGFDLDFESDAITGHIDFLQIRNGNIHILDYKPDARKETHAHVQLTIYALALARRTSLPLKFFKCGWFDEKDYFDFFPLQGVYRRRDQR
jgi:ATP-dependent exoDNAse (exonuclease V) beta subunit